MNDLQKMGGVAALIEAAIFVAAMVIFFTFFASALPSADYPSLDVDPVENVAFLVDNQAIMYVFYLVVYVVWARPPGCRGASALRAAEGRLACNGADSDCLRAHLGWPDYRHRHGRKHRRGRTRPCL